MSILDATHVPSRDDGDQSNRRVLQYDLTDEEVNHAMSIAESRHSSYGDGRTRNEDWAETEEAMRLGTVAEIAMALVYPEFEFDDSISAIGDGGVDGTLRVDGDEMTVDVKARDYDPETFHSEVELLVAKHHLDEREDTPDAFVGAYVSEDYSEVKLYGWVESDRIIEEDRVEEARAYDENHDNYVYDFSDLNVLPDHDNVDEHENVEAVWV
jgi:hypothetical protein